MAAANAGRKAKPSHLKILDGRGNGRDSGGRTVPEPPKFQRAVPEKPIGPDGKVDLSPAAERMWDAIIQELPKADLLKPIDGYALQVGCETFARWYEAKRLRLLQPNFGLLAKTSQGMGVSPLVRVESEASREFRAWCAEFGLTPAAEVKLAASVDPGGDNGDLF